MDNVIVFISSILSIILFFKVWGMCNNVRDMKDTLSQLHKDNQPTKPDDRQTAYTKQYPESPFALQQLVIDTKTEQQFRIVEIIREPNGGFIYIDKNNNRYTGNQIEDFEAYWAKRK